MAAPLGVMDIEVAGAPALSVGGPLSVLSRISVVLVKEANSGGTPREDNDIRLLAGGAKLASVTICEDSLGSPCVGGRCPPLTLPEDSFRWYLLRYRFR